MTATPTPTPASTSLLAALDCRSHVHLILGGGPLAASRAAQSLAAGAHPVVITPTPPAALPAALAAQVTRGMVMHVARVPTLPGDLVALGRPEVDCVVDAVFVVPETLPGYDGDGGKLALARRASEACRRLRIPVNVVDAPALCSFALLSVHADGPLQIGVTTNGRGCKLASRIRREVAAALPVGLGAACARLGEARRRVREEDGIRARRRRGDADADADVDAGVEIGAEVGVHTGPQNGNGVVVGTGGDRPDGGNGAPATVAEDGDSPDSEYGTDDSIDQTAAFNRLVMDADHEAARTRRMRWLAQVCEYWPLKRLAAISDADIRAVLKSYPGGGDDVRRALGSTSASCPPMGRIILAGSGPGHPDLVTRATYKALQAADLVLADKLVPDGVLGLVPRRTRIVIARKFPGNADRAQEEILALALEGVRLGQTVVRLKQGDPFVYGRGGEEVTFFREALRTTGAEAETADHSDRIMVLPGVTSALSAPLFASVPPTQRDIADQVLVCTGTGKQGRPPPPPEYVPSRTVVFLMALHRIGGLVEELTERVEEKHEGGTDRGEDDEQGNSNETKNDSSDAVPSRRHLWPLDTPCTVIERASCPDQRVMRTTLRHVAAAVEQEGSRPPGLLVAGRACEALYEPLPEREGEAGWRPWVVEDGFRGLDLDHLLPATGMAALDADG